MKNVIVESSEIVWCPDDDRYVVIFKSNGEIVGLNYMQGGELIDFRKYYCEVDKDLTNFYKAIVPYLTYEGTNEYDGSEEVDRINMAIWAHFEYRNLRDGSKY
jgi:hypothetical protein